MTHDVPKTPDVGGATGKVAVKLVATWIVLPSFLLAVSGDPAWWKAWVYSVILLVPMTAFAISTARRDPGFFSRRFKMQEKERAQRHLQAWGAPFFLASFVVPPLDHRFGWSDPPLLVAVAGLVLALAGYLTILRVFLENRWAGRTVETWAEQEIISTGPYAIVRHPMYTGTLFLLLATPVALGSWWGLLAAPGMIPFFVFRIRNEEAVLVRELPGYEDYRRKVRHRLVPGIW